MDSIHHPPPPDPKENEVPLNLVPFLSLWYALHKYACVCVLVDRFKFSVYFFPCGIFLTNTHAYRNSTSCLDNFFNSINNSILVVHFQQICMRIVTVRTLLTTLSIHFGLPEISYPVINLSRMCNRTERVNHPDNVLYQDKSAVFLKYLWCFGILPKSDHCLSYPCIRRTEAIIEAMN